MKLNEGLEWVGECAFYHNVIENIIVPSTLKRIEAETFRNCYRLTQVDIPNGVEYIGDKCFYDCKIEEITLPGTLKEIGQHALTYCRSLRTVHVKEGCALDIKKYVDENVEVLRE